MKILVRLCVAVALVVVGLLMLVSGPAQVADAQSAWSRVALDSEAHDVVLDEPRGVLYVSLPDALKITVVDAASGVIVRDIALVGTPAGIDLSPEGGYLYVALNGVSSVAIIDLTDDSVQTISVGVELQSSKVWDVYALNESQFLASGNRETGGFPGIVLVDHTDSSQTRFGLHVDDRPVFTGNVDDDFVYVADGLVSNRLRKIDLTIPNSPVVATAGFGSRHGVKISRDGSLLFLGGVLVGTSDLEFFGNTPVGGFPAPLGDGQVAFVEDTGQTVRVVDAANRVALTRSTACQVGEDTGTTTFGVGGVNASADSLSLYFKAGASLCAASLEVPPCAAETDVFTSENLNLAIKCFNAQTPAGDHTITLGTSFAVIEPLTPVTLDSPGIRLTITGDYVLSHAEAVCCDPLITHEGSSDLYLERLLLDAGGQIALTVGVNAGELWVLDSGIVGTVEVDGGTFVLLRSVIRDSASVGIEAKGGIVSVYRSLITRTPRPIRSTADILAVGYSIIEGSDAEAAAIHVRGDQPSEVEILGSVIFDATRGLLMRDAPNTSALIVNSTLWGNYIGVHPFDGDVTVTNSTIAQSSFGIISDGGEVTVTSSILTNIQDCSEEFEGTNNFSQAANCGPGFTQLTTDDYANFGTLNDHGCAPEVETPWGCTALLSLRDGHSAIGAGKCDDVQARYDFTGQLEIDQRGLPRLPASCDAGAYESSSTPTCDGLTVTINLNVTGGVGLGTNGDDVILGTSGDDVIDGRGGNDTICALDGRDRIHGGPGADTIFGGFGIDYIFGDDGEDTLDGEGGSDRMFGGAGNDLMLGDSGADRMYGGPGDDEMRGMGGQDFMWGEAGNDLMQGNFQTDNMWGGPGDDTMFGAGGKDSLFGEAGNDSLSGGNNTDYLDGGDDVDTANGGRGRDKPVIEPKVRASNGQLFDGSGCIAETIVNCQPTP